MSEAKIRFSKVGGFTTLFNDVVQDRRLSLKTIGLLAVMKSLVNTDWEFSVSGMAKYCRVGKDYIRGCLKELEDTGYLLRERTHKDDGTFGGNEYVIFETSKKPPDDAEEDNSNHRRKTPTMDKNQRRQKPSSVNQTQIKEITQVKENNTPLPPDDRKVHFAENVTMTNEEHNKLLADYGPEDTAQLIKILDDYKGAHGKRYKSDYRAILMWVVDRLRERSGKLQRGAGERHVV